MKKQTTAFAVAGLGALLGLVWLLSSPGTVRAHCDTLDGPVAKDARAAFAKEDVSPVLKWVKAEGEEEVRSTFRMALAVRKLGPEGKELAERHFLETLVRIHRAGEGAPYTGLKPEGAEVEPAVAEADRALEAGSADRLVRSIGEKVERGLRERFARVLEVKKRAGDSIAAGREYVAAYVDFVHYAEGIDAAAGVPGETREGHGAGEPAHHHDR